MLDDLGQASLEIHLETEFDEARRHDARRDAPSVQRCITISRALGEHRVGVERVVQLEARAQPHSIHGERLGESQIELIASLTEHRARLNEVDRHVLRVGRQIAPE